MDLQISVFLLFILFTAGTKTNSFYNVPGYKYRSFWSSRYCYECMDDLRGSCVKKAVKCPFGFSECFSSTTVIELGFLGLNTDVMKKTCTVGCRSGSLNFGNVKTSTSCCGTDFCNAKDPDPRKNTPNGNKCYYCDDQSCSNILSCSGTEDRCLTSTVSLGGPPLVVKGCISKSLCDTPTSTDIPEFSCCEGNLCNGDKHATQGVTQSSMYNRDKRVTQSFIQSFVHEAAETVTQSSMHNGDTSVTQNFIQSFMHKEAKSDTQSSVYNGAQSVTQSFLFLCSSLLSYFLLH
ncbi:hypothetical protein DPX16_1535 [Anabarilius grahami]|uniref:UPAR/Ly6 domain-containing protein n=1 Tax=Anabarilius grahami TaxID=495550 RepID=A0A3N0XSM9_ANAGA|nr:hypothetical protein DPX16_1535 [Anabarilius grahami]